CRIDWNVTMEDIYNHIRGLSPYPGAWTQLVNDGKSDPIKIFKTKTEQAQHNLKIGTLLVEKKALKVAVKEGYISLLELQLPGKRRMQINEVLNGLNLEKEAHLL
ncbi:MAG: methionyl-tRNA formyltransferase, partial [Algicola sp.]|nr:methionyl-tRNA formyltransferase [Algicola sp.]